MSFFDWLNPHLRQVESERDWLRLQVERVAKELYAERKRHLKREDELVNQVLLATGGRKLSLTFEEDAPQPPKVEDEGPKTLPPSSEAALRQRAHEYAEQRSEEGATPEAVEAAYQMMLNDAEHWLNDE